MLSIYNIMAFIPFLSIREDLKSDKIRVGYNKQNVIIYRAQKCAPLDGSIPMEWLGVLTHQ
jgi:hypothetical protein